MRGGRGGGTETNTCRRQKGWGGMREQWEDEEEEERGWKEREGREGDTYTCT